MNTAATPLVDWELVLARSWRKLALTFAAALGVASVVWQTIHGGFISGFIFHPYGVSAEAGVARRAMLPLVGVAVALAAAVAMRVLRQARAGRTEWPLHRELLLTSLMTLPVLSVRTAEFDHPLFISLMVVVFGLALAHAVSRELEARDVSALPDLTDRQARIAVGLAFATFTAVLGFIAHWRFITFHSQFNDASWEIGSVAGILRHGLPTASVAAWLWDGKPLPQPYFGSHVPLVNYLYVPFYFFWRDPRLLFWLQAAFMASGAFGAYMLGRRWFEQRTAGVLLAVVYLLHPSIQGFCLHDLHANVFTIPAILLAVGFMEAQRPRLAVTFAILTALCREEAPLYAAAIGLFWMFSREDVRRFRTGLIVLGVSIALELFFALFLMPYFGGKPRQDHFSLFFDDRRSLGSMIGALVLDPLGAAFSSTSDFKIDYLTISLVPMGGLALLGWRAAWFTLPAVMLMVPSGDATFFVLGVNYSAPIVPGVIMMSFAGMSRLWTRFAGSSSRRAGLAAYVLATALLGNFLYGNIASKTFKFEYGHPPYRRTNEYQYKDILGYVEALPPYGPQERALWEVIRRVPHDGPIITSWIIHSQLSDHDVAFVYGYSGGNPPPETRARYAVLDKLPAMETATEPDIARLRRDPQWEILFENSSGVIFKRRAP